MKTKPATPVSEGSVKTTSADLRMLRALVRHPGTGPNNLGSILWGKNEYHGSACSAPYARSAGKILNRLRKMGFAELRIERGWSWWYPTARGKEEEKRMTVVNIEGG